MSPVFRRDSEVCVGAKGSGTFAPCYMATADSTFSSRASLMYALMERPACSANIAI